MSFWLIYKNSWDRCFTRGPDKETNPWHWTLLLACQDQTWLILYRRTFILFKDTDKPAIHHWLKNSSYFIFQHALRGTTTLVWCTLIKKCLLRLEKKFGRFLFQLITLNYKIFKGVRTAPKSPCDAPVWINEQHCSYEERNKRILLILLFYLVIYLIISCI